MTVKNTSRGSQEVVAASKMVSGGGGHGIEEAGVLAAHDL
jgi:hypothetical protein